jgi:hypothetical protein
MEVKADKYRGYAMPAAAVAERAGLRSSGAAGVHLDQTARMHRTGQTNRIGSRSSRRAAAIRSEES